MFARYGGRLARALMSLMHAESPRADGVLPIATGENSLAIGDGCRASAVDTVAIGADTEAAARASIGLGHGNSHVAAAVYATFAAGEYIPGASISILLGDDRDGQSTVLVDETGANPVAYAPDEPILAPGYAPAGGTTVKVSGDDIHFYALGQGNVTGCDAGYGAELLVVGTDADGEVVSRQLMVRPRDSVTVGSGNVNFGKGCVLLGGANAVQGEGNHGLGRRNTLSGHSAVAIGHQNAAVGVLATAIGHGAHAEGLSGGLVQAGGYFSTPGDAQTGRYLLAARVPSSAWAELTTDHVIVDRMSLASATWLGRGRLALREHTLVQVTADVVARDESGSHYLAERIEGAVVRDGATVEETYSRQTWLAEGGLQARLRVADGALRVEVAGADGVACKATAHVTTTTVSHAPPVVDFPFPDLSRTNIWPADWEADATLQIDFARDLAGWRAARAPGTEAAFGRVTDAFGALGDLSGADLTDRGLGAGGGAAPAITDLAPAGGPAVHGTIGLLVSWAAAPSSDETLIVVRDADGRPAIRVHYDATADTMRATVTGDGGGETTLDLGRITVGRIVDLTVAWDTATGSASFDFSETFQATPAAWTGADLSEVLLLHDGDGQGSTARIWRLCYAPHGTPDRIFGVDNSPRFQEAF